MRTALPCLLVLSLGHAACIGTPAAAPAAETAAVLDVRAELRLDRPLPRPADGRPPHPVALALAALASRGTPGPSLRVVLRPPVRVAAWLPRLGFALGDAAPARSGGHATARQGTRVLFVYRRAFDPTRFA